MLAQSARADPRHLLRVLCSWPATVHSPRLALKKHLAPVVTRRNRHLLDLWRVPGVGARSRALTTAW